jgi:hypothetical protein
MAAGAGAAAQQHIGEIRCGRMAVELDTASSNDGRLWAVSQDVRRLCGITDSHPVPGRIEGDALLLFVPSDRLEKRSIAAQDEPYTPGQPFAWIDWTSAATSRGMFLLGAARYGHSRLSAWYDSVSGRGMVTEAYWHTGTSRIGRWFDQGGFLLGYTEGVDPASQPVREKTEGVFRAPVFGDSIRVLDADGREVQRHNPGAAGLYDLTSIAAAVPPGGRIVIDGQTYQPDVRRVIEPGQGLQWFVGRKTFYDFSERRQHEMGYAHIKVPFKLFDRVVYGTLATDGGRIESYYRGEVVSTSGYISQDARGRATYVQASAWGMSASVFRPDTEAQRRAGSVGYTMFSATRQIGPGFASVFATRFDSGARFASARYAFSRSNGLFAIEATQQTSSGKTDSGLFLTATIFFEKASVRASTSGAFFADLRGEGWQVQAERSVTLDRRQYDSVTAIADAVAARVFARYNITLGDAYVTATGRVGWSEGEMFLARQEGDAILNIEGPPGAMVMIDNQQRGKIPSSGRAVFPVTPDTLHRARLDDEDSLDVIESAEQTAKLRTGEAARLRFESQPLK